MRQAAICFIMSGMLFSFGFANEEKPITPSNVDAQKNNMNPFTGKITRNKVRIRLKPTLEAPILKELSHEDLVIVVGEADEFYAVKPPQDLKAYIFRTFVLDNVVEGSHVNVRLEPDTEAPIIGQLNSGDVVKGTISPLNSKWLEIDPPESTKFFICKEYVQNIGDPSLMAVLSKRKEDVNAMLEMATAQSQAELQKPYEAIRLENAIAILNTIISQYTDFPSHGIQAKEQLALIQDTFLQKKLSYLENKANQLEKQNSFQVIPERTIQTSIEAHEYGANSPWNLTEKKLYEEWLLAHPDATTEEYYAQQHKNALLLNGFIEPYIRSVKNKPGDFILVSKTSKLPVAYLYSTKIDLNTKLGQEVSITALPRPNHDFAFPAYFVLSID